MHAHAEAFAAARGSAAEAMRGMADCLAFNAPVEPGLRALGRLHRALRELLAAGAAVPPELQLTPETMAFNILATDMVTALSQLWHLFAVLPAALAADQPPARRQVARYLRLYPLRDLETQRGRARMPRSAERLSMTVRGGRGGAAVCGEQRSSGGRTDRDGPLRGLVLGIADAKMRCRGPPSR